MARNGKDQEEKVNLEEIQAAMERDRADLASKILSRLPSTTISTSSTPSTINSISNFTPRPPTLGLGATLKNQATAPNNSLEENRLKGRLIKGGKSTQSRDGEVDGRRYMNARDSNGVEQEEEGEEDREQDSRSATIKKRKSESTTSTASSSKGKKREETKDPFSMPPPTLSKKEKKRLAKEALAQQEEDGDGDSTMKSVGEAEISMEGMTKAQRKKMRKKMRLALEKEEEKSEEVEESRNQVQINGKGKEKEKVKVNPFITIQESPSKSSETIQPSSDQQTSSTSTKDTEILSDSEAEDSILPSTSQFRESSSPSKTTLPTFQTSSSSTLTSSLSGAQFRTLNQSLYTLPSSKAVEMVKNEPKLMEAYHQGFRDQTKKWPAKPVEIIARKLREGQSHSYSSTLNNNNDGKKNKSKDQKTSDETQVMFEIKEKSKGRYSKNVLIADLGCGEAPLARILSTTSSSQTNSNGKSIILSPLKVLSYDLLPSQDGWVQGADVASRNGVPLPGRNVGVREKVINSLIGKKSVMGDAHSTSDGVIEESKKKKRKRGKLLLSTSTSTSTSTTKEEMRQDSTIQEEEIFEDGGAICDVVVFCLCLMGTNWIEMIREGRRILGTGGELIIAEVSSRMTSTDDFIEIIESLGFQLGEKDLTSNTHFQLYSFVKSSPSKLLSNPSKAISSFISENKTLLDSSKTEGTDRRLLLEKGRKVDEIEEDKLIESRGEVLKPCLYKRR